VKLYLRGAMKCPRSLQVKGEGGRGRPLSDFGRKAREIAPTTSTPRQATVPRTSWVLSETRRSGSCSMIEMQGWEETGDNLNYE
jgi:hypothetical protein